MNRLQRLIASAIRVAKRILHIPTEVPADPGEMPELRDEPPIPIDDEDRRWLDGDDSDPEELPEDTEDEEADDFDRDNECFKQCFGYVEGPFPDYESAKERLGKAPGYIYRCNQEWWICDNS